MKNTAIFSLLALLLFSGCNKKEQLPNFLIIFTDDQRLGPLDVTTITVPFKLQTWTGWPAKAFVFLKDL